MKRIFIIINILFCAIYMTAQDRFVYLTTDEVKIDSLLPYVGYSIPLPENFNDSIYNVSIVYPEYIDMSPSDIEAYNRLSGVALPEIPQPDCSIVYDRKQPLLCMGVQPLAFRDGRYRWLASFMLKIESKASASKRLHKLSAAEKYANHSILSTGRWAKIRVAETGVHILTEEAIRKAGFNNINKVRVYGYGGNLQPERLESSYLTGTDDLKEVVQCVHNGRHMFYGYGPVSWNSTTDGKRTRNPYSNYGYYFITEGSDDVNYVDSATFVSSFINGNEYYHNIYEQDGFALYHGGRNLCDKAEVKISESKSYNIRNTSDSRVVTISITVAAQSESTVSVLLGDSLMGSIDIKINKYYKGNYATRNFSAKNIGKDNKIVLKVTKGGPVHLDYISLTYSEPQKDVLLSSKELPVAQYVHNITNQDHHADEQADLVIIIPTSQKTLAQAQQLAEWHRTHDGMKVNIVPADELYNEFSSGTPDANAYRRYMKMLYDRATTEEDMPKYLLLFADGYFDNRLLTDGGRNMNADDLLLCFESENSVSEVDCYVDDGWYGLLDEGEGVNPQSADIPDVAVGRFPVNNAVEAQVVVDKTIAYAKNENGGAWQNTIVFLGDDGNNNLHMHDVIMAADSLKNNAPEYLQKRVMWDTYKRETTSSGNRYPEVESLVKQYNQNGALVMDYAGHGSAIQLSHEKVLSINDFENFTNKALPAWITASCDVMPFDNGSSTIGEVALLNSKGGAIAFYGTTRTVYASYNDDFNNALLKHLLYNNNDNVNTFGEALRKARAELITDKVYSDRTTNKLHYHLVGDPALKPNRPTQKVAIDMINGKQINGEEPIKMKAGDIVKIEGHVINGEDFNGKVTITVNDSEERVVCQLNNPNPNNDGASTAFEYTDRPRILYSGTTLVKEGKFEAEFTVPLDINYSDESGLITAIAVREDGAVSAHGITDGFTIGDTGSTSNNEIGPSIYCYLNSPGFVNGDKVNSTPYFVATINDEDGINTTGAGIGHDLTLTIDGEMTRTYYLNDVFTSDEGTYKSGKVCFSIPELTEGIHSLQFKAWDIFNNPSTAQLQFEVVNNMEPNITSISCTDNPAKDETTFIINHNRMGSSIDVVIEVMDMSGKLLWQHKEQGVSAGSSYPVKWDLSIGNGQRLQTGVYLYRARIASEDSDYDSKSKKLIVVR